jgi:hypothetical protein
MWVSGVINNAKELSMSKRMHAAVFGLGLAAILAGPAHARLDNGPVSSVYDGDRKNLSRSYSDGRPSATRKGTRKFAQYGKSRKSAQYGNKGRKAAYRGKARTGNGSAKLASRSVTAAHGGGGGGGASRGCLTASARALLGRIETQFGAVQVISTCRPGARIAGSGRPSKHASGNAVDFNAGGRKGAIIAWLRANHHSGGTMTYARMNHIHVDIGPRFVSLGSGGGRRKG